MARAKRSIPNKLQHLTENPFIAKVQDREEPIEPLIERVMNLWSANLFKRSPPPAYIDSISNGRVGIGNTLDEFTFLMALASRRAVVNIPYYDRISPKVESSQREVISDKNRHGELLAVLTNDNANSLIIKIKDYNVAYQWRGIMVLGAATNFAVGNYNGEWNPGLRELIFWLNSDEKTFLSEHDLTAGEDIRFEYIVNPELSKAYLGSRFLEAKALNQRATLESRVNRVVEKHLRARGIRLKATELRPKARYKYGPKEKAQVTRFTTKLQLPMRGLYPLKGMTADRKVEPFEGLYLPEDMETIDEVLDKLSKKQQFMALRYATEHSDMLSYGRGASASAPSDMVEIAMYLYGYNGGRIDGNERPLSFWDPDIQRNQQLYKHGRKHWSMVEFGEDARLFSRLAKRTIDIDPSNDFDPNPDVQKFR